MTEKRLTRRTALAVGCGAICAHALGCGGDMGGTIPSTASAGAASSLSVGTIRAIPGAPAAIARDAQGIYALSLLCTHQGCDMSGGVAPSFISCSCHGSVFDVQGNVLRGPAISPLAHFVVTEDAAGQLTVHLDQTTSASTRIPA